MKKALSMSLLATLVFSSLHASADLINDSKLSLEARNMYWNNDNRNNPDAQSKSEQWGQGFILRGESGYTDGVVGAGLDAIAMWGFRLNAKQGNNSVSGLFPYNADGTVDKSFATVRLTGKVKYSESELRFGALQPNLPILMTNDGRLLPQLFRGVSLGSMDLPNLDLNLGYIHRTQGRNSTDFQRLKANGPASNDSNQFLYGGGTYSLMPELKVSYYFAQLEDFYNQHFVGINADIPLGDGVLKPDLRYFNSRDEGSSYGGRIDNDLYSALLTYKIWGHSLGLGFQKLSGDTKFAYLDAGSTIDGVSTGMAGASTYTIADSQVSKFLSAGERTWLAKYSYDFAEVGLNGLAFSAAYLSGDKVKGSTKGDNEWERNIGLSYTVPAGTFKNLGLAWKNAAYRTNVSGNTSQDENRVILTYKMNVF